MTFPKGAILKYTDKEGRVFLLDNAEPADLPRFVRALRVGTREVHILHENDIEVVNPDDKPKE